MASHVSLARIAARDGWRCRYCRRPLNAATATRDHLTPRSRGGTNGLANLGLACRVCNGDKGAMTEREYLALTRPTPVRSGR